MLASKYFPHYLGLNCLYHYLAGKKQQPTPLRRQDLILLLGACALLFVLFNPVVLLPSTLLYMLHYAGEGTITHHGYQMMGRFYYGDLAHLHGGMPIYFYPLLLILKTPLPVLIALVVGLVETWKRRREPGPFFLIVMFLFWIVPFSLVSAKWLRWMLSFVPTVYILAGLGRAKIFTWASALVSETRRRLVPVLATVIALVFLVEPAWVSARNAPYYTLYLNPLGLGRTAYYFPHDEMNDMGLRDAIAQITEEAPQGAGVGGATAPVFAYYFHKFGRDDLHYFDLSRWQRDVGPTLVPASAGASPDSTNAYVVIQDGRKYFENINFIQRVESDQVPVRTVEIGRAVAVRLIDSRGRGQATKSLLS